MAHPVAGEGKGEASADAAVQHLHERLLRRVPNAQRALSEAQLDAPGLAWLHTHEF